MTTRQVLGACLIALPFVALIAISIKFLGWKIGWTPFAFVAAVVTLLYFGVKLLVGS